MIPLPTETVRVITTDRSIWILDSRNQQYKRLSSDGSPHPYVDYNAGNWEPFYGFHEQEPQADGRVRFFIWINEGPRDFLTSTYDTASQMVSA